MQRKSSVPSEAGDIDSSRRRGHGLGRAVPAAVLVLALAASTAACSSSKSTSSGNSTSKSTTSAAPASPGPSDSAAVSDAYVKLFAASTPLDTSVTLLQDGEAFRPTLVAESKTSNAQQASVTVSKVVFVSANRATVTFTLLLKNSPVLKDQTGYAIRENGTWKVAGTTFCGLLAAQGTPPAVCTQPAATSLPN
jgi:ABC-type glycerol-3-phosphate transport system substrate-binding protein